MSNQYTLLQSLGLAALLGLFASLPAHAGDTKGAQTAYQIDATTQTAGLDALDANLRADPAFKEAGCASLASSLKADAPFADYVCANPGAKSDALFREAAGAETTVTTTTSLCPPGCYLTYCPYPFIRCCNPITARPCGL